MARAAGTYVEAFRNDPADYYPGINALTLGRLWEQVTGRQSKLDLPLITVGVRWAIDCTLSREKTYWTLVTRAELAIAEGTRDPALDDYSEAAAIAVGNRDRFALDSSGQTLKLLQTLGFRREIVSEAANIIHAAEQQLDALIGAQSERNRPRLEIYLPLREPEFLLSSINFATPHWQQDYDALKGRKDVLFRIMPDELGPTPDSTDVYDRANRWMLHSALSCGLHKLSFVTLWDGNPGDGQGGTDHMVSLVRKLTGRQPAIIDPKTL